MINNCHSQGNYTMILYISLTCDYRTLECSKISKYVQMQTKRCQIVN